MSQHDFDIANQEFADTRADINNALVALASNSSGNSAPASPTTYQFWLDTSASPYRLKMYDGTDWVILAALDPSNNIFRWGFDADGDSYFQASSDDQQEVWLGGSRRLNLKTAAIEPETDGAVALGATAKRFSKAWLDDLETAALDVTQTAASAILKLREDSASVGTSGVLRFTADDNAGTEVQLLDIGARRTDGTAGSVTAEVGFSNVRSGSFAERMTLGAGLVVGSPSGGDKGAGTINATAVYDDNVLLSCFVLAQAIDGAVDEAAWDAAVPDRVAPAREVDEPVMETVTVERLVPDQIDGERVLRRKKVKVERQATETVPVVDAKGKVVGRRVIPKTRKVTVGGEVEPRRHEPMRKFLARIGTDHDPLTLDGYAKHWREKRHLTALPNEAKFAHGDMSAGEWVQRLVETAEIQAVLIEQLNARTKTQQAQIDDLAARLAALGG